VRITSRNTRNRREAARAAKRLPQAQLRGLEAASIHRQPGRRIVRLHKLRLLKIRRQVAVLERRNQPTRTVINLGRDARRAEAGRLRKDLRS
jgi:hypothetical protein